MSSRSLAQMICDRTHSNERDHPQSAQATDAGNPLGSRCAQGPSSFESFLITRNSYKTRKFVQGTSLPEGCTKKLDDGARKNSSQAMNEQSKTISRQELYLQLWRVPISRLTLDLGYSYVELVKFVPS